MMRACNEITLRRWYLNMLRQVEIDGVELRGQVLRVAIEALVTRDLER